MKNKKAQANIIVIILIILISLAAIIIVWNVVNIFLQNSSEEVDIGFILNQVELISADEDQDGNIDLRVRKIKGESEMSELVIYLNYIDGSVDTVKKTNNLPAVLESNIIQILESEIDSTKTIESISSIPVYGKSQGSETNSVQVSEHVFIPTCADADLNTDNVISFGDVSIFSSCFGQSPPTSSCIIADINRDGAVAISDNDILASCFGQSV